MSLFKNVCFVSILLLSASLGVANPETHCLAFQGALLYWTPCYDDSYFVINGSGVTGTKQPTPNGKRVHNCPAHQLGFRLEGIYGYHNCVDFRARWSHLLSKSHKKVTKESSPPQLWPIATIPSNTDIPEPYAGEASSHITLMWNKGEVLADETVYHLRSLYFQLREGIEWSYIRNLEKIIYQPDNSPSEKITFHGHTKGIGPQLGFLIFFAPEEIWSWYPKNCFFKLMSTATLLAANTKTKIRAIDTFGANNKITQCSFWRLISEWHFSFGIDYTLCFPFVSSNFELAYELTRYPRGVSKLIFDEAANPGHSFNNYSDFYLYGITLSWTLLF